MDDDIYKLLKKDLLKKCKEMGLTKYSSKNKLELIELIKNKQSEIIQNNTNNINTQPKLTIQPNTEQLGITFEKSICLLYAIEFDGTFKYNIQEAENIKNRLIKLKQVFPYKIKHIAKHQNRYDFIKENEEGEQNIYLSAKTTKKDGKVCPQVIGQPTKKRFCELLGLNILTTEQIKEHIILNITNLLDIYIHYTFDCYIIYYNKYKDLVLFVKLVDNIMWTNYDIKFTHIIKNMKWLESSSIIIKDITIGEFQIHNHRDSIKFRWNFENLLYLFNTHFDVINL
jgi:hypothetical protein